MEVSDGHPDMFLLIGRLLLEEAIAVRGIAEQFAAALLSALWEAGAKHVLLMLGAATTGVCLRLSNTAPRR